MLQYKINITILKTLYVSTLNFATSVYVVITTHYKLQYLRVNLYLFELISFVLWLNFNLRQKISLQYEFFIHLPLASQKLGLLFSIFLETTYCVDSEPKYCHQKYFWHCHSVATTIWWRSYDRRSLTIILILFALLFDIF